MYGAKIVIEGGLKGERDGCLVLGLHGEVAASDRLRGRVRRQDRLAAIPVEMFPELDVGIGITADNRLEGTELGVEEGVKSADAPVLIDVPGRFHFRAPDRGAIDVVDVLHQRRFRKRRFQKAGFELDRIDLVAVVVVDESGAPKVQSLIEKQALDTDLVVDQGFLFNGGAKNRADAAEVA